MLLAPSKGKAMTPAAVKEYFDVTLAGGDVSLPLDFPPACSTSLTNLGIFHFVLSNSAAEENGVWTLGAAADCYCFGSSSSSPALSRAVVKIENWVEPTIIRRCPPVESGARSYSPISRAIYILAPNSALIIRMQEIEIEIGMHQRRGEIGIYAAHIPANYEPRAH